MWGLPSRVHSRWKGVPSNESTRDIDAHQLANGVNASEAPSSTFPPGSKSSLSLVHSVRACLLSSRLSIFPQKGHGANSLSKVTSWVRDCDLVALSLPGLEEDTIGWDARYYDLDRINTSFLQKCWNHKATEGLLRSLFSPKFRRRIMPTNRMNFCVAAV